MEATQPLRKRTRISSDEDSFAKSNNNNKQPEAEKKEEKDTKPSKRLSLNLASFSELPEFLKDNPYIHRGYRVNMDFWSLTKSVFRMHNETINIWTHLISAVVFLMLFVYVWHTLSPHGIDRMASAEFQHIQQSFKDMTQYVETHAPRMYSVTHNLMEEIKHEAEYLKTHIVLLKGKFRELLDLSCSHCTPEYVKQSLLKLATVFQTLKTDAKVQSTSLNHLEEFFQGIQQRFHTFLNPNLQLNNSINYLPKWPIGLFLISAVVCFSCSALYHTFWCHSPESCKKFHKLDHAGITFMISATSVATSMYLHYCDPGYQTAFVFLNIVLPVLGLFLNSFKFSDHITSSFSPSPYVFASIGLLASVPVTYFCWQLERFPTFFWLQFAGGMSCALGAVVFVTRFPESAFPGRFDIWFQSHSIFHVFVTIGALCLYLSLRDLYEWRIQLPCQQLP